MSKIRDYINSNYSIQETYQHVFGRPPHMGKIFCPFHDNKNTPAAKIYGNIIRCFSCNRSFGPFDLLQKYAPEKIEEIKGSVLMEEQETVKTPKPRAVRRGSLDLSKGIIKIIEELCQ